MLKLTIYLICYLNPNQSNVKNNMQWISKDLFNNLILKFKQ